MSTVHVPELFRNFFLSLVAAHGLHGEENDLDHQHSPDNNVYIFTKKSGRSAGWLYLSELGSLVSGMGDNQVISSTCCVKIITAQGATTKTPHQQLSDCEAWRKNRLWQQQSNKTKIRKSITNKKWKVHFMMCVGSKK